MIKSRFTINNLKTYSNDELMYYRARAILSQGEGSNYSKMLENRIEKIYSELKKRKIF
jgi:hypothetical protein